MGTTLEPTDQQLAYAWSLIDEMEPGTRITISDFAKNKPELFLKCCKMYIDCYPMKAELSSDYKQVKKLWNLNTEN